MNTEQLIEKHLFGKKPEKWDDDFDRIQHLSVNEVRAMLDEHAKCVLSDVSGWLEFEGNESIFNEYAKRNCVCKFDDGTECRYEDEHPMAILTHFRCE